MKVDLDKIQYMIHNGNISEIARETGLPRRSLQDWKLTKNKWLIEAVERLTAMQRYIDRVETNLTPAKLIDEMELKQPNTLEELEDLIDGYTTYSIKWPFGGTTRLRVKVDITSDSPFEERKEMRFIEEGELNRFVEFNLPKLGAFPEITKINIGSYLPEEPDEYEYVLYYAPWSAIRAQEWSIVYDAVDEYFEKQKRG